MKKYRKNHTARIPACADAALRHESARSGVEVLLYRLLQSALVQKERRNDLPELTPARARELYEAYRRGEMADVQLMWDQLEERDETLFTVLHARLGALAEMPWAVNIDADLAEDMQPLAEQQQTQANELLAAVENLPEALVHLGMADFRGVAALELTGNAARMRWEVIEPWNLCRPVRRGPWYYNAEATATPTRPEELDLSAVIIREAQPIDLPAMFLICAKYLSVHAWDAFLEVFGIPNIFLEMPPATPEEKALEFDAVVQRLIGEGRGTIPNGAKFHTVETSKDNTQSFEARAKWCNEAIIQLATGGLLTVTTQSGSGTLAGNAHSDSFSRLCAASARSISAAVNRQFLRPALEAAFPHSPILVSFELAPEPVDDRLQVAQLIATLASAGYRAKEDDVAELMSMQFTAANMNPTDLYATKAVGYVPTMEAMQTRLGMPLKPAPSDNPASVSAPNSQIVNRLPRRSSNGAETVSEMMNFEVQRTQQLPTAPNAQVPPVMNRGDAPGSESPSGRFLRRGDSASEEEDSVESPAESEPPLNDGELEALRLLGGGLNPEQVAADAEYAAKHLRLTIDDCRFEGSAAAPQDEESPEAEEELTANSCNQYGHDAGCDGAGDDPSSPDDYAEAEEAAEERERREDEEDERREREMDASSMESAGYTPEEIERVTGIKISDDEEVVTNGCNQHQHTPGCMKFAVLKKNKGSRSSKGNPKNPTTKSNTTLKAARLAKPQAQVDAAEKAHKKTAKHGGSVLGAATVGKSKLNIRAGSPGVKREEWKRGGGSRHQKAKHGSPPENTSDRDAAKAMVLGKTEKTSKGKAVRLYKNIHAVTGKEKKRREMTNITAYKKK